MTILKLENIKYIDLGCGGTSPYSKEKNSGGRIIACGVDNNSVINHMYDESAHNVYSMVSEKITNLYFPNGFPDYNENTL